MYIIIDQSTRADQIVWAYTCRALRIYATKRIWKDIYITSPAKILSLLQVDNTWQTAAAYGLHVQNLYIDIRLISNIMAAPGHEYMEGATIPLLALLPNLTSCTFEGPLYQDQLTNILQVQGLRKLDLRGEDQNLRRGSPNWMEFYSNLNLEFSALASLQSLQSLKIGRLMMNEVLSLAQILTTLPLVDLNLSSGIWVPHTDPRYRIARGQKSLSPVVAVIALLASVLAELYHQYDPTLSALGKGLPPTLKTLFLADRYHNMQCNVSTFTMSMLLESATEPCEGLQRLEITFRSRTDACLFMRMPVCCHGRSSRWCAYALGNWKGQWDLDVFKDKIDAGEMENPYEEPAIIESRRALALGARRTLRFERVKGNQPLSPIIQRGKKHKVGRAQGSGVEKAAESCVIESMD